MQTQPLTSGQQNWLRVNTYFPVVLLLGMLGVLGGIFLCLLINLPDSLMVRLFVYISGAIILLILAAAGIHVYNNYMDLRDGVAQVRIEKLIGKRTTGRSPKTFYADFENTGAIIVMGEVYEKLELEKTYKVTYSPRTRHGWEVDLQS
jgi:hypothetical protein